MSKKSGSPRKTTTPTHIAIIMDGNGRWARQHGLPRLAGHRSGTENLRRIIRACAELGVQFLTIYAFSTENWARPKDEVEGLQRILEDVVDNELAELDAEGVQIRHIGRLEQINERLQTKIRLAIEKTKHNSRLILNIAWNYGGRDEIIHAVQGIIKEGIPLKAIDAEAINRHLYTAGIPDPDLIIRTSGELRTSNFLLWQSAYSEWYVTPTLWPDFNKEELIKAIAEFNQRERRFGMTSEQLIAKE